MNAFLFLPIVLGLLAGTLVNYLSDVLPRTRRFSQPACPWCETAFTWKAFLTFQPCPACHRKRSLRAFLVPLCYLAGTLYLWLNPPGRLGFPLAYLVAVFLGVVLVIDVEHRLILHPVSLAGAGLALVTGMSVHGLVPTLIGGAVGFGSMLAFYFLGEVFSRYMSKRRGQAIEEVALGFGDVNLSGITGLFLGWPVILAGLLFTIFAGGLASLLVIAVMLARRRYQAFTPIPYAPFLVLAILFYLYR